MREKVILRTLPDPHHTSTDTFIHSSLLEVAPHYIRVSSVLRQLTTGNCAEAQAAATTFAPRIRSRTLTVASYTTPAGPRARTCRRPGRFRRSLSARPGPRTASPRLPASSLPIAPHEGGPPSTLDLPPAPARSHPPRLPAHATITTRASRSAPYRAPAATPRRPCPVWGAPSAGAPP